MPNHRNVYMSLATSMSKTGKFQLTPLISDCLFYSSSMWFMFIHYKFITYEKVLDWCKICHLFFSTNDPLNSKEKWSLSVFENYFLKEWKTSILVSDATYDNVLMEFVKETKIKIASVFQNEKKIKYRL